MVYILLLVVMAVIGGLASIWGAIFGAGATRVLSEELLVKYPGWDVIIYGLILVLIMVLMPEGLFVKLKDVLNRLRIRYFQKGTEA